MCRVLLIAISSLTMIAAADASIIQVNYTGTYVGTWSGNYDPQTGITPPAGYGEGPLGSGSFELTFLFDTTHPRAIVTSTSLQTADPACGCSSFPEPGPGTAYGTFESDGWTNANYSISGHHITSSLNYNAPFSGAYGVSVHLSIQGDSLLLPSDIFSPVTINNFSGTGNFNSSYGTRGEGGGTIGFDLSVKTLKIMIDGVGAPAVAAVPEPSTWAMLLIGFAGLIGFRRCKLRLARRLPSASNRNASLRRLLNLNIYKFEGRALTL